ncbi:uncharacterized protein LOC132244194 isoform X1 [Alligator mississippiensis]|uniref:uncharacterized protein LOC132244194 isoform X1 n=1 Tax=Alligator mississippiensis TaxID=8496 RepID=UPI002877B16C|nr:uncharacterized protein LOC132244194 isoform X1 [Alligator mississippiensis]
MPEDWKKANVVPIFKKGRKVDLANYRPISLTSILGKVLEKIIKEAILNGLADGNTLRDSQHGSVVDKMQDARHILVVTPWDPTPALSAPHLQTSLCGSRETGPSGAPGPEARLPPAHQACHSFCRKAICLTGDKVKRHLE